jgi:hypothetical protein
VWDEDLTFFGFACDVIDEAGIIDFDVIVGPFGEEFGGGFENCFGGAVFDQLHLL